MLMELSLDDLLEEVEGALEEGSSNVGSNGRGHTSSTEWSPVASKQEASETETNTITSQLQQGAAAGAKAAIPTPTPKASRKAQETEAALKGEAGATTAATMTARSAELCLPTPLDTDFDSDSESLGVAAAVPEPVGVGFDSESPLGRNVPPALGAKDCNAFDSACNPEAAEMTPAATAADVDFDSDSPPARTEEVVAAAAFTAADIDFDDSDSSVATPVHAAAGLSASADPSSPAGLLNSDLDPRAPTADSDGISRGGVDELPRLASDLQDGIGDPSSTDRQTDSSSAAQKKTVSQWSQQEQQHSAEIERYPTAPVGTVEDPTSVLQGKTYCAGGGEVAAHKRRRCGTVYLGGVATDRGFCASSLSQRACDNLRCTDCNFEVLCFHAQAWAESTMDYMFLRNNAPDRAKLGARLLACSDACAYACQCSWQTVREPRVLSPTERPRWACGGHIAK